MINAEQDPIDPRVWSDLLDLAGEDDPMMIAELIDSFVGDAEQQLQGMRTAVAMGDTTALRRFAHALRSPSASLGANVLAELCGKLENLMRESEQETEIRKRLIEAINLEYTRVVAALMHRRPPNANGS